MRDHNVVAMSYDISASAVEKFVEAFYDSFLGRNFTSIEASFLARKCLATDKLIMARFGELIEVVDFLVPVILTSDHATLATVSIAALRASPSSQNDSKVDTIAHSRINIVGREFDITKLERHFLKTFEQDDSNDNIMFIHGMVGVGKSFLVDHLSWW